MAIKANNFTDCFTTKLVGFQTKFNQSMWLQVGRRGWVANQCFFLRIFCNFASATSATTFRVIFYHQLFLGIASQKKKEARTESRTELRAVRRDLQFDHKTFYVFLQGYVWPNILVTPSSAADIFIIITVPFRCSTPQLSDQSAKQLRISVASRCNWVLAFVRRQRASRICNRSIGSNSGSNMEGCIV